ncbi:hypothetical protein pdam_00015704, partial [Pocillopora damicornis]
LNKDNISLQGKTDPTSLDLAIRCSTNERQGSVWRKAKTDLKKLLGFGGGGVPLGQTGALCIHRDMKHLGSLESTQEARVALSYASSNSDTSFMLSKLPILEHLRVLLLSFLHPVFVDVNVTVNWLSSCETLTCAKQLALSIQEKLPLATCEFKDHEKQIDFQPSL